MKIPFVDLSIQHLHLIDDLVEDYRNLLQSSHFILGPIVETFEQKFAKMCGAKHCIGVNSGTDAMVLSLKALGIGPGDEVIIPAYTFIATADAVIRVGAKPVLIDVQEDTQNMALDDKFTEALTAETKAIMPVHLFGRACDVELLGSLANELGLFVIEDAAQACGTLLNGKWCGTMSKAGCFSFYPTKNLGASGDGGAITTDDDELAAMLRKLRDHGKTETGAFDCVGYNSRLSAVQAMYLNQKLEEFEDSLLDRIENAKLYALLLKGLDMVLPEIVEDRNHTYNNYTIFVNQRDQLRQFLTERGIGTAVYYNRPLHLEPALAWLGHKPGDFPVSESLSHRALSLPNYPGLTKRQIETVCGAVKDFMSSRVTA